jgi:hypothetical protein
MTTDEAMIEEAIEGKLSEWAKDPRVARRRSEIAAYARDAHAEYKSGNVERGTLRDLLLPSSS